MIHFAVQPFRSALVVLLASCLGSMPIVAEERPIQNRGEPADLEQPVQVFVMLGQSNMLGFGKVGPTEKQGTLENLTKVDGKYPHLLEDDKSWSKRNDVRYVQLMHRRGNMSILRDEWLTVKGAHIGP